MMMISRFSTRLLLGGMAAVTLLFAGVALADGVDPRCVTTGQPSLSLVQVHDKLVAQGYTQIRSIDLDDDGCVEAKGVDSAGRPFDLELHPSTGEIVSRE